MPHFIPGLELSRRFYRDILRPILDGHCPGLAYAAALVGPGSDVLGFDTEMSTDHDWGPRALVFLRDAGADRAASIDRLLRQLLPTEFLGYPVAKDPSSVAGAVDHRVRILTLRAFVWQQLAFDVNGLLEPADWLTFPAQTLLELTSGAVFHDGTGELTALRQRFAYYPRDIWLYLLAAGWQRIGQEEHLMPRAGFVGDELGSAVIGSRLVRDVMNLAFLLERQYAPYAKWFGTAFGRLSCAKDLTPFLWRAQRAESWPEREVALCDAFEYLARLQNALGITEPLAATQSSFHERPFRVIHGERFATAILGLIVDPDVKRIAEKRLIGGIDQFSDNTDLLSGLGDRRASLRGLFG
jgi:hypothetical protein